MKNIEIGFIIEKAKIEEQPRVSVTVSEYIITYIYEKILLPNKESFDEKFTYNFTLGFERYNSEEHKFFQGSVFDTNEVHFFSPNNFQTSKLVKSTSISLTIEGLDKTISPTDYANILYDAYCSFLIKIVKKTTVEDFRKHKGGMDLEYINSFPFPVELDSLKILLTFY